MRKLLFVLAATAFCSFGTFADRVHAADLAVEKIRPAKVKAVRAKTVRAKVARDPCGNLLCPGTGPYRERARLLHIPGNSHNAGGCVDAIPDRRFYFPPWLS